MSRKQYVYAAELDIEDYVPWLVWHVKQNVLYKDEEEYKLGKIIEIQSDHIIIDTGEYKKN